MKRDNRIRVGWFHQHQIEALDRRFAARQHPARAADDSESCRAARGGRSSGSRSSASI